MSDDKVRLVAKNGYALVEVEMYSGAKGGERPSKVKLNGRWYPVIVRKYKRILTVERAEYDDWFLCYAVLNEETFGGFHFELLKDHLGRFWAKREK